MYMKPKKISPETACLGVIAVSVFALGGVFVGQYFFGLHPCHLCLYQRWPFGVIIIFGLAGLSLPRLSQAMIGLSGVAFLLNAGIAFFHSGVERKWWAGLEGCTTPDMSGSIEDLMKRIQEAAVVNCDEIAFKLFGLSIANYNVLLCLISATACAIFLFKRRPSSLS